MLTIQGHFHDLVAKLLGGKTFQFVQSTLIELGITTLILTCRQQMLPQRFWVVLRGMLFADK